MSRPVFISYARKASLAHAVALHAALGAEVAYLDRENIAYGEPFPERLSDALLNSRVVVVFADPLYFTNWCCLLEWRLALTPYLRLAGLATASQAERDQALHGIVVTLPPGDMDPMLDRLPPSLREHNWAAAGDAASIAELVRRRLAENPPTLRERYQALGGLDTVHSLVREAAVLPLPHRIGDIPHVPLLGLPQSIHERFVGRAQDIWRIHHVLTSRSGGAGAASLTGAIEAGGGFGKTRLALEYLHRFGTRHFRGGLFWIDAEQDVEGQLYAVVTALNPSAPDISVLREAQGGVAGALARLVYARRDDAPKPLFVIDNVPEPAPGAPPLPLSHWCPVLGEVAVLATSRRTVSTAGGDVVALSIDVLDVAAAVRLLRGGAAGAALPAEDAAEIAEWVGHLPLALELLNGLLTSGAVSGGELLRLSRERRPAAELDAAMEALRGTVPEGTLRGITEAFAASYERLTVAEQLAARLIAWMAPAVVPELVVGALEVFTPAVRATLRSRNFVTASEDVAAQPGGALFGGMHRVLADFLRSRSPEPEREHALLADAFDGLGGAETVDEQLRAVHLLGPVLAAFVRNSLAGAESVSDVTVWAGAFVSGLFNAGAYEWAQRSCEHLLSAVRRILGEEHPDTLSVMNNLAETLRARGDRQGAQELMERVLSARRRLLGEEHPDTLTAMGNLASALWERGDYEAAQDLEECVLSVSRRTLGEDHPDTLMTTDNLAQTLRMRGDLERAMELQEQVLSARRRIWGDEHSDTLVSMHSLAALLSARGDHPGAQALLERVLEAMRRDSGEEHPRTLIMMANLALTLWARGDLAGAQRCQEQVVSALREIMGDEHPETLKVMNNLAVTLWTRGDYAGAQDLQERLLTAMRRVVGEEHPDTLVAMTNLASTRRARGDLAGAQDLHERALVCARRTLGDEHPTTLLLVNNLAETLHMAGDYPGARDLLEQTLPAVTRILGDEHPQSLKAVGNLAMTLFALGDVAGARGLQERVLAASRRILGDAHPDTLPAMNNFAIILEAGGDDAGAQELLARVVTVSRETLGDEHPDTLRAMNNLAAMLLEHRNHREAQEMLERVVLLNLRILGEEHPYTLVSMGNLAVARWKSGDHAGAQDLEERELAVRRRVQGEDHPETLTAMHSLAETLRERGDLPRARELGERVLEARRRLLGEEHPDTRRSADALALTLAAEA